MSVSESIQYFNKSAIMDMVLSSDVQSTSKASNEKNTALALFLHEDSENAQKNSDSESNEDDAGLTKTSSNVKILRDFFSVNPIQYSEPAMTSAFNNQERKTLVYRNGKIFKRKPPSKYGYKYVHKGLPGHRFCKQCNKLLPLSAFYKNTSTYSCRAHHYLAVKKSRANQYVNNRPWYLAELSWNNFFKRAYTFGYSKLRLDKKDVSCIIKHLNLPLHIYPSILPIDPTLPLRPRNFAIVSQHTFKIATELYKVLPLRSLYIHLVQTANLVPKNFDIFNYDNPYADPDYVRVDYDISELIKQEVAANIQADSMDQDVIQEYREKGKVPWLECEKLPPGEAGLWIDGAPVKEGVTKLPRRKKSELDIEAQKQEDEMLWSSLDDKTIEQLTKNIRISSKCRKQEGLDLEKNKDENAKEESQKEDAKISEMEYKKKVCIRKIKKLVKKRYNPLDKVFYTEEDGVIVID